MTGNDVVGLDVRLSDYGSVVVFDDYKIQTHGGPYV